MKEKSSLYLYREAKLKMGYEECYSNNYRSELLAKARTNSLQLAEWYGRGKNGKGETKCPLCKQSNEDLIHFLIDCKKLEEARDPNIMRKIRVKKSKILQVRTLLFNLKEWDSIAEMIQKMWNKRKTIIEQNK